MKCRVCGRTLPRARAEVRDYCTRPACVEVALPPLELVAVPVAKSIPQILPASAYGAGDHLDARRTR